MKESTICLIDGENSRLYYRGYDIEELAEKSAFEEVAYLLIYGVLPTRSQLEDFRAALAQKRRLQPGTLGLLRSFPTAAHPMDVLRTAVSSLGLNDPHPLDSSISISLSRAIDILAQAPSIVAAFHRIRSGSDPVEPLNDLSTAANFLYMLNSVQPSEYQARVMDIGMILHAEHEMNASTFSCIVTASTLPDLYSAITSGIGTLKGPLHGGANEAALKMILEVGRPEAAEAFVARSLTEKRRIMGFGHRVYRNYDPRYKVLKSLGRDLAARGGMSSLFETALRIEEAAVRNLASSKVFPNVDFYSGLVFHLLGIPSDLFTPIFAMSRVAGWAAHVIEYLENNRLIRPKAYYTGEIDKKYLPIMERKG